MRPRRPDLQWWFWLPVQTLATFLFFRHVTAMFQLRAIVSASSHSFSPRWAPPSLYSADICSGINCLKPHSLSIPPYNILFLWTYYLTYSLMTVVWSSPYTYTLWAPIPSTNSVVMSPSIDFSLLSKQCPAHSEHTVDTWVWRMPSVWLQVSAWMLLPLRSHAWPVAPRFHHLGDLPHSAYPIPYVRSHAPRDART